MSEGPNWPYWRGCNRISIHCEKILILDGIENGGCEGFGCIKNGLELSHALVSSFLRLIYSCKRNYVLNTTFILWNSCFFGLSVFGGSCF